MADRRRGGGLIMAAAVAGGLAAGLAAGTALHATETPLGVQIVTAEEVANTVPVVMTGTVEAVDSHGAAFRMGGSVQSVSVSAGDRVTAGQELARLDATQIEAQLSAAEAGLRGAQAALLQAELNHDRVAALLERGTATQADLDAAVESLAAAQAATDQAGLQRDKARSALDDTVLRATADAIVTAREVEPGQVVGSGQSVLDLAGQVGREALFLAPDGPMLDGFLGREISLTLLDTPEAPPMKAVITEISPIVDSRTGAVQVRARLEAVPEGAPLLGEAVVGRTQMEMGSGVELPWTALTATAAGAAVWVVGADGDVALRPVTVLRYVTGAVILGEGLKPGEKVVGDGSHMLYPGRPVLGLEDVQ